MLKMKIVCLILKMLSEGYFNILSVIVVYLVISMWITSGVSLSGNRRVVCALCEVCVVCFLFLCFVCEVCVRIMICCLNSVRRMIRGLFG